MKTLMVCFLALVMFSATASAEKMQEIFPTDNNPATNAKKTSKPDVTASDKAISSRKAAPRIISRKLWKKGIVCSAIVSGENSTVITFLIPGYDITSAYHLCKDVNFTSPLAKLGFKKVVITDGNGTFLNEVAF